MKLTVPRSSFKSIFKKRKPGLQLRGNVDLMVQLSCLLFLQRLAEEARTKAFESRSSTIKPEHVSAVAKTVLKKSRG
ncbi:centromere protein W [Latimeria chalumnae]|uniref:centromere protein W n=1 Tax=Latimeria chalumnae TaxID=7897 RepID=UPI0003C192E5|nr:PREDICTED: centromere protein W [Latimeria chalumnae]|eukprot:XP_006013692.1 PREDICTED: centromere protein W [Latimeria chalumnae]